MDNLRWWLLLIAAVMFSMSGCASARDVATSPETPTHFASTDQRGEPPTDLSGRWVGTWKGLGLFDSLRHAYADATLIQQGAVGLAHLHFDNTIAAGVPWMVRLEGSKGVRLVYRVSGSEATMRDPANPAELIAAFTLVDGRLIGTLPNPDGPVVIRLVRQDK